MFVCSPNSDSFNISDSLIEKFQIDMAKCMKNLSYIKDNRAHIEEKIQSIYKRDSDREPTIDVDQSLYDNFISNKDREICNAIQHLSLDQMSSFEPNFEDVRKTNEDMRKEADRQVDYAERKIIDLHSLIIHQIFGLKHKQA